MFSKHDLRIGKATRRSTNQLISGGSGLKNTLLPLQAMPFNPMENECLFTVIEIVQYRIFRCLLLLTFQRITECCKHLENDDFFCSDAIPDLTVFFIFFPNTDNFD